MSGSRVKMIEAEIKALELELDLVSNEIYDLNQKAHDIEIDIDDLRTELDQELGTVCEACGGLGFVDVGDCENGVTRECPQCKRENN